MIFGHFKGFWLFTLQKNWFLGVCLKGPHASKYFVTRLSLKCAVQVPIWPLWTTICSSNFGRAREPTCTKLAPICAKKVLGSVTYMPTAASSYVTSGGLSLHPFIKRKLMKKKLLYRNLVLISCLLLKMRRRQGVQGMHTEGKPAYYFCSSVHPLKTD